MIKINSSEQSKLQESREENRQVKKEIAKIRGAKVMEFVGKAVDTAVNIEGRISEGEDNMSAPLQEISEVAGGAWEKLKENIRQGEYGQSIQWWLLDHGSTAAFDSRIVKREKKIQSLEDRKQREARQFDELNQRFNSGEKNEMDIERNKRAHLAEFDERLKKEQAYKEKVENERKEHDRKVQELKNRVNDRITTSIEDIKLKTNYDSNKERQKGLKEQIIEGEKLIGQAKKEHKELEDKCKLLYGDSWLRKKFNITRKESDVFADLSAEELKSLSPEQKVEIKKAKDDMKRMISDEKISLSNVARETRDALDSHTVEIERLERNLAKLKSAKDPVDTALIKADTRIGKFEAQRKSFRIADKIDGIADEPVGEHVKVPGFKDVNEVKDNNDSLFGIEVADLEAKLKSPSALYGKASAFNFKVSGFEAVSNAQKNTEVLLAIRKETDQVIFKLENTITKIKSTIDSGTINEKDKPEAGKQIEVLTNKIAELKTSIMDKIPLDSDGNINAGVDQIEVLEEICPGILTISNDKVEVFGNELKTDSEKVEALETLQIAIAEIDALPDPLARLKAYTETIAFGLDNKLRLDLNKDAIDQIYNSIVREKIPQLFTQIEDPRAAVNVGMGCIRILSESGFSPASSSEMIQSITIGISENIKNTSDSAIACESLLSFTEKFCKLDDTIVAESSSRISIGYLLSAGLAQRVINRIKENDDIYSGARKIADFVFELNKKGNNKISHSLITRLFGLSLNHLKNNLESINDNTQAEIDNMYDSESAVYEEAYKYVEQRMSDALGDSIEELKIQKTEEVISAELEQLKQKENPNELAQYAVDLAYNNQDPKDVTKAIGLAQLYCHGNPRKLRIVGDIFAPVENPLYHDEKGRIYDAAFDALRKDPGEPVVSYMYLMDSLNLVGLDDRALEVAESAAEIISAYSSEGRDVFYDLNVFMDTCSRFETSSVGTKLSELSFKISKEIFENISSSNTDKDKVISLLILMEKNGFSEATTEMFLEYIGKISTEEAFDYIQYFSGGASHESPFTIEGELNVQTRTKYAEIIADRVINESTSLPEESKIKNLVVLYRALVGSNFNEKASGIFENNINLSNQESVVRLVDDLAEDTSDAGFQNLVDTYVEKALELSGDNLDGVINLMTHWAAQKKDNSNIYVKAVARARELANHDFEKLMNLAKVMNDHEINLGLQITIQEAEQIAKENLKSIGFDPDSGFTELEKVIEMYAVSKGLEGEARRLEDEIEDMKNEHVDLGAMDENVFVSGSDDGFSTDLTARSTESSFPGSVANKFENNPNSINGSKGAEKKKKGFFANLLSAFFGMGNEK